MAEAKGKPKLTKEQMAALNIVVNGNAMQRKDLPEWHTNALAALGQNFDTADTPIATPAEEDAALDYQVQMEAIIKAHTDPIKRARALAEFVDGFKTPKT